MAGNDTQTARFGSHPMRLEDDLARLESWFAAVPAAAVALSGGGDSSLVAFLGRRLLGAARSTAYIAVSPSLKAIDLETARQFCSVNDIRLEEIGTAELDDPNYAANPIDRCFFCKTNLYAELSRVLPDDGSVWILNGTNRDDLGDYRPGLEAATASRVRSPLAECGLDKPAVRALARSYDLACWDRPASPCLASRIPYGQPVTLGKLRRIEAAEALLNGLGFPVVRVRHHEGRAVVEVPGERLADLARCRREVEEGLRAVGFAEVELDAEGFVSGRLNRVLVG